MEDMKCLFHFSGSRASVFVWRAGNEFLIFIHEGGAPICENYLTLASAKQAAKKAAGDLWFPIVETVFPV